MSRPRPHWSALLATIALASAACGSGGPTTARTTPSVGAHAGAEPFARGGPDQIVFDSAGNLYGADCGDAVVFRVGASGTFTVVAGAGEQGFSGDGGLAVKAKFACPSGVAVATSGDIYVSDHGNNRIRRVDRTGMVSEFAGSGPIPTPGFNQGAFGGDGGPAGHALFRQPVSLAFDSSGNLYVSDRDNGAVRKITPKGVVTTVAGTGERGFSGDGG